MTVNHLLGRAIIGLAIPSIVAIVAFVRAGAGWRHWIGPGVFLAFLALMIVVDYVWPVEFRSPMRYGILVPYLVLFFGAILLMGLPMFRMNRLLWLVTVATTGLLLASMGLAMFKGVGCATILTDAHHSCLPLAQAGQQTHRMKKMTGAAVQNRVVPLQPADPVSHTPVK